jgi:meckelin
LSQLFKDEITKISEGRETDVKDKSWIHYFLGTPSDEILHNLAHPVFYRDPGESFKSTSLVGLDIRLLVGNSLFFYLMHIIFLNVEISLFFTFLWDGLLRFLRNTYGEDNISKKTMIDERFLI